MAENHTGDNGETNKKTADTIFRQKSIERVSGPEELNDYIRVTTPSVWIVLIAIVTLLAGILMWSIFGRVEVHKEDGSTQKIAPITYIMN